MSDDTATAMRGTNQSGMRAYNEKLILTLLWRQGGLAKSDLTRMTGLSAQTVSVIMRRLEADGLVRRGEPQRGRIGQPSVPMTLDPDGACSMGLKVGRRSSELVVADFHGKVVDRISRVHRYPDPDNTVAFARAAIGEAIGRMDAAARSRIAGLGIAIPFYLWNWAQALGVPDEQMAGWRDADIRAEIAKAVDFPVYLGNDASTACAAEVAFGPADAPDDFLYLYVGYFIGGGVVLNGALFTGPGGNSGALGPMPVPGPGGSTLQLIDVASLSGLERELVAAGAETGGIWERADQWDVDQTILGDWIAKAAGGLAHTIVAACSIIDFSAVVIDGWLPVEVRAQLVEAVLDQLARQDLTGLETPQVRAGTVGADARALGAASLPIVDRFIVDRAAYRNVAS
ncbi:ROK family transcriptional regulator [Oricola sp.]|uniref:ROK family transcriptional regulator n=1 Tax=Oricola sp. TaxID=1979950 RepID=UPI003BAAE93B